MAVHRWTTKSTARITVPLLATLALGIPAISLPLYWWTVDAPKPADRVAGWATVLALSVASLGVWLAVMDRIRTTGSAAIRRLVDAEETLRRVLHLQETRHQARLLGAGRCGAAAANIHYSEWCPDLREPPPNGRSGDFTTIGEFFAASDSRRLMIIGEPGHGKTVLAIELLIQVLDRHAAGADEGQWIAQLVPVRLDLGSWDTGVPFEEWLAAAVAEQSGMPRKLTRALVEHRRVLPVLDGLDEMDCPTDGAWRAAAAVAALNGYLLGRRGAPLVVTCRTDVHDRLRSEFNAVLFEVTTVRIHPLEPREIFEYLDHEYRRSGAAALRHSWDALLGRADVPGDDRLLEILRSPWKLTLAVAFHRDGGGDIQAIRAGARECGSQLVVNDLLLGAFVAARARRCPPRGFTADQAVRWCRTIAAYPQSRRGVVPHLLWSFVGAARIRRLHMATAGAVTALLGLSAALVNYGPGPMAEVCRVGAQLLTADPWVDGDLTAVGDCAWLLMLAVGFPALAVAQAGGRKQSPRRWSPRQLRFDRGRRQFARSLLWGLGLVGTPLGAVIAIGCLLRGNSLRAIASGATLCVVFALLFAVARGLTPLADTATDPRDAIRNDLMSWMLAGVMLCLGYEVPMLSVGGVSVGAPRGLVVAFESGLLGSLAFGLGGHAWIRYVLTLAHLRSRGPLPWRLGAFLDWGCRAGVFRSAGTTYQFRHVELYEWLRSTAPSRREPAAPGRQPAAPDDQPAAPDDQPAVPGRQPAVSVGGGGYRAAGASQGSAGVRPAAAREVSSRAGSARTPQHME